ncbi:transposase, Ptta/En/Spm, transposase, Tnp1/En/Spm-like protein [Tanacetum coccineum]
MRYENNLSENGYAKEGQNQILSWKKVGPEARNKLWDEITRYFDVDLTVRKLVMNRLGQLLRNFRRKLRQTYILPNQDTPSKLNEVPAKYTAILKAEDWVNFVNYTATEEYKVKSAKAKMARSKCVFPHTIGRGGYAHVKEKMKETEDKIKEGTLQVDQDSRCHDHMYLGKEKEVCKRSGKWRDMQRYFDLPRSKQQLMKNFFIKVNFDACLDVNVSPVEIHPINSSADEEGETVKSVGAKYTTRSIRKDSSSQDSQSKENVSVLPQEVNGCKQIWMQVGVLMHGQRKQVVLDPKATPPSTIQMITGENKTAPKVQTKRKNVYVSSDAMQKEANKKRSQKALVY